MALLSEEMDSDLLRLWGLVAELSEQLNANRAMTAALQSQASQAKGQVIHSGTGFVLRRFNTDLSQEVFESELERMNASLIIENQTLLHENKQLNSLLKEYEQTLEAVMAKFRSQAHAAQQHELNLTRHYETLLLSRESNSLNQELQLSTKQSESLARLGHYLRLTMRSLQGEDPEPTEDDPSYQSFPSSQQQPGSSSRDSPSPPNSHPDTYREGGYAGQPPPLEDWALEREIEITRLEKENEELRRLLSIGEDEELMKDAANMWDASASFSRLTQNVPVRRGLLSQNRARMMNQGGQSRGPGLIGLGGQGAPGASSPSQFGIMGGQSPWGQPDPTQKKGSSYLKEFPT